MDESGSNAWDPISTSEFNGAAAGKKADTSKQPGNKCGKKRGVKTGQKISSNMTQEEWYNICEKFKSGKYNNYLAANFLRFAHSGDKVSGTRSKQAMTEEIQSWEIVQVLYP